MEQSPKSLDPSPEAESIINPEIAELLNPLKNLLTQLRERIEKVGYQLVIGDDASGRIPALIVHKTLESICEQKGLFKPEILFFAGSRGLKEKRMYQELEAKQAHIAELFRYSNPKILRRALIVTDAIQTGDSLLPLVNGLNANGIDYDIASITLGSEGKRNFKPDKAVARLSKKLGGDLFYAKVSAFPAVFDRKDLSGVQKDPREVFSFPVTADSEDSIEQEKVRRIQEKINSARKDSKILARKLLDWYQNSN
jgi:hypothetical protein